jgi:CheY-like chemotaxis protein
MSTSADVGTGADATSARYAPGGPGSGRIAVVDDVEANVRLLKRVLLGADLGTVEGDCDPKEALARCLADPPDVLLLDLHMPGLDGFAFLSRLRAGLPEGAFVPVIVLTADATNEARDAALRAGAMDFLTKPFDAVEVVLRVRNMLQTSQLYRAVNRHNAQLQAALRERLAAEEAEAKQRALKLRQIEQMLCTDAPAMVFQPILETSTGIVRGVEALARFGGEPRRPPNEWFAQALEVGLGARL